MCCAIDILTFCNNIVNDSHAKSELNEVPKMVNLQGNNNQLFI